MIDHWRLKFQTCECLSSRANDWRFVITVEGSIGCYRCSTRNGSDVNCEDPFHPAMSVYEKDCNDSKVGHIGKFPASFCLKIVGTTGK